VKFVVDAQLPRALRDWLRRRGHPADHVAEIMHPASADAQIVQFSAGAVIITKDRDFVRLSRSTGCSVIWLRCGNATTPALLIWFAPRWPEIQLRVRRGERLIEVA